jgi:hypothetical protein
MILVNGCSFTTGEESPIAWPRKLDIDVVNIATAGASNDYILRSTVDFVDNNRVDGVIIAWTSPNRIEISNKHLTSGSFRKYGKVVEEVFRDWDEQWAYSKFLTQIKLLDNYLKDIPHVFVSAFDIQKYASGVGLDCYLGWPKQGLVEWMGDCSLGSGGHPLEAGHQLIADRINEHIRNLGWIS